MFILDSVLFYSVMTLYSVLFHYIYTTGLVSKQGEKV